MYEDIMNRLKASNNLFAFGKVPKQDVCNILFGPYYTKVVFENGKYALLGRGAFNLMYHTRCFGSTKAYKEPALIAGSFSESASDTNILLGGEHANERVVNCVFGAHPQIRNALRDAKANFDLESTKGAVTIGGNVTISTHVTILSGVTIGDGAVIGAGSVVTKDVPPFAIVAGNPARILRYRFNEAIREELLRIRWWDFSEQLLVKHFDAIQRLDEPGIRAQFKDIPAGAYAEPRYRLVISARREGGEKAFIGLAGVEVDGEFIPREELPEEFDFFEEQARPREDGKLYMIPDIFVATGLVKEKKRA